MSESQVSCGHGTPDPLAEQGRVALRHRAQVRRPERAARPRRRSSPSSGAASPAGPLGHAQSPPPPPRRRGRGRAILGLAVSPSSRKANDSVTRVVAEMAELEGELRVGACRSALRGRPRGRAPRSPPGRRSAAAPGRPPRAPAASSRRRAGSSSAAPRVSRVTFDCASRSIPSPASVSRRAGTIRFAREEPVQMSGTKEADQVGPPQLAQPNARRFAASSGSTVPA